MTKQILTATIVLVGLFSFAAAQSKTDGFKDANPGQTLEGVGEIGLSVKYGQADGLDAAMQPTTLQKLRDHARTRLRQGGVPLLQTTDETDLVGKPRLVVTITLKKATDPPPALLIECKFFQRVRLWRDRSQEMELPTWSMSSSASGPDSERVLAFFDKPLDTFVSEYRAANPNSRRSESRAEASSPAQVKPDGNALQGLAAIHPEISLRFIRFVDPNLQAFSDRLRTETENRLKQAGIPLLLYAKDTAAAGYPFLNVEITLDQTNSSGGPAIDVRTQVWQRVQPVRELQKYTYLPTWELQASDGPVITEKAMRAIVESQVDQFIQAYKAANPKLATQATVKTQ